jgi:hypothetical protein
MVRTALEQSFAHARTVFGSAADAANQALTNWQNRAHLAQADANEIVRKSMALADENMATAFEFAEKQGPYRGGSVAATIPRAADASPS